MGEVFCKKKDAHRVKIIHIHKKSPLAQSGLYIKLLFINNYTENGDVFRFLLLMEVSISVPEILIC